MSSGENLWQVSHLQIIVQKSSQISFWTSWEEKKIENFGDFFPLFLWRMQFSSCMQLLGQNWSIVRPEIDTFAQFSLFNNWCHKSYCTLYSRGCKTAKVAWFYFNSQKFYPFFNLTDFSWPKNGLFLRFIFSWVALMVSYNTLLCIAIWVEIVS